jgi:two-component system nitrogen regulation sensor histidine kinase NtrY
MRDRFGATTVPPMHMPRRVRLSHLRKVQALAFACGLPGLVSCLLLLTFGEFAPKVWITVIVLAGGGWLYFALRLQTNIVRPLQTASNMLSGMREGDFALQASYVDANDPLGQVMLEINLLREVLSEHRMGAIEAHALLEKVVDEIDAAVFTFNPEGALTLCNRAAAALLDQKDRASMLGKSAQSLGLELALEVERNAVIGHPRSEETGRFLVRRGSFREAGQAHSLLILIDVGRNLREEELQAWKRIIRVLGHELNNSMAPIKSIANSLRRLLGGRETLDAEDRADVLESLEVIESRADSLSRFMRDYARLAKLPTPQVRTTELRPLVQRIVGLSERLPIGIDPEAPAVTVEADPDQLEQVLINLAKNAIEAVLEQSGKAPPRTKHGNGPFEDQLVKISWHASGDQLRLQIDDEGPGLANLDNLFTPFFSTKAGGSGIGLTLCRQIVEAHGGSLRLRNREDVAHGCRAEIMLPLRAKRAVPAPPPPPAPVPIAGQ